MEELESTNNIGGMAVALIVGVLLGALIIQFAWNIGLVGALAAAGLGQISGISYWTALGLVGVSAVLRGLFYPMRRGPGTIVQILKAEDGESD